MFYKILTVSVFAIAFAYVESTIVVYLRLLYYPEGFTFPLKQIPGTVILTEIGREIATLIVLAGVAYTASRKSILRLAYFAAGFAIWDIFYYIWLKILLNWPDSLLTWDILFLIPLPWTGPVLSPIIVSACLLVGSLGVVYLHSRHGISFFFSNLEWAGEFTAVIIILLSYLWNVQRLYLPETELDYPWTVFLLGLSLGVVIFIRRFLKFSGRSEDAL